MSLQNEISNVGKDTGITVTLRFGRVRHLSANISLQKGRTGNGSPTQASLYPLYIIAHTVQNFPIQSNIWAKKFVVTQMGVSYTKCRNPPLLF